MEDGNPRSYESAKIETLTEEEILHLLDVATDFKIKQEMEETPGDGGEAPDASGAREADARKNAADMQHDGADPAVPDTVAVLADLLTIQEHFGYLKEIVFCHAGGAPDDRNRLWMDVCDKMGMEYVPDSGGNPAADAIHARAAQQDAEQTAFADTEGICTAVVMETDADEQKMPLYALPASHKTVQAVMYAVAHATAGGEKADET